MARAATNWFGIQFSDWEPRHARSRSTPAASRSRRSSSAVWNIVAADPTEYVAYFAFLGLRPALSGDGFLSPGSGATKKSASSMPSV